MNLLWLIPVTIILIICRFFSIDNLVSIARWTCKKARKSTKDENVS
ncbi:MAG: hypothetical protein FWG45_00975 [Oscillospiraceae bacterium]|nr:hypothetical protein [Oscillospiraceae bacterium]